MSKEKQILQLRCKGYSQRKITEALQISRNTVAKVFNAMASNTVSEDTLEDLNYEEFHRKLFPEDLHTPALVTPDFEYIHKELLKSGVILDRIIPSAYTIIIEGDMSMRQRKMHIIDQV